METPQYAQRARQCLAPTAPVVGAGHVRPAIAASLFALLSLAPPLSADDYPRQPGVDVQSYTFRITLSDDTDEIVGETTVDVRFVQDDLPSLSLDLASPAAGKGMTVSSVTSEGAAVPFTHRNGRLLIRLPAPAKAGEHRAFTIQYRGVPAGGLNIGRNRYGERTFFSANWPDLAHQWLPTIDHPYDKAASEFLVTAPAKYQVVANGRLQETIDLGDGRRLTHWKESVPIATWLDDIGVAQFAVRHFGEAAGVPLETWVFHQDRDNAIAIFEAATRQAIEFFSERIGPYPYEKLADVEAAGFEGGMEHASEIFFGQRTLTNRSSPSLVAHETAHQWFGDSVTESDWDDVWLSEGFATYFALLDAEREDGREAFVAGLKRSRETVFQTEQRQPGVAVIQTRPWKGIPSPIVYQKGAWTLHMLRGQIGDEKFWEGIREYCRRYRDGNASTADFRNVMEETAGADLGWFFDQWLTRPGSPVVEGAWTYRTDAKQIAVDLSQTQPGDAFRLPIQVAIAPEKIVNIEMTAKRQRFEIAVDKEPSAVTLDPNTWLLMDAKFAKR
jgi:aminopeptidase N